MRKILRAIMWLALAVLTLSGVFVGLVIYTDWSRERQAHKFCDMIPIGSSVSAATDQAAARKIFWGSNGPEYDFYFFHFFAFDKTVCEVFVGKTGKVISKKVEVELD